MQVFVSHRSFALASVVVCHYRREDFPLGRRSTAVAYAKIDRITRLVIGENPLGSDTAEEP